MINPVATITLSNKILHPNWLRVSGLREREANEPARCVAKDEVSGSGAESKVAASVAAERILEAPTERKAGSGSMTAVLKPVVLGGSLAAIPSKSNVHRLLICAGLADRPSSLLCPVVSEDIEATTRCLAALGAKVRTNEGIISIWPVRQGKDFSTVLDPGESGSTYRFFTPLASALGASAKFSLHGKLPSRPMEPLWNEMERHNVSISGRGTASPSISGRLTPGEYRVRGDISSQFFTGLLFALPLLDGDSRVSVLGRLDSASYIDMTLESLRAFSVKIFRDGQDFIVPGNQKYIAPKKLAAEGDWSNSAFWLCAGAARGRVAVSGLKQFSRQGDKAILKILHRMGAQISCGNGKVIVESRPLNGCTIDVGGTPDLVPALAVAAAAARGTTRILNAGRLRLKESDRIESLCAALKALGGRAYSHIDSIIIEGTGSLRGGTVDACGDHRIAMFAAAASVLCSDRVKIIGADAVNKSYPGFFDDFAALGGKVKEEK